MFWGVTILSGRRYTQTVEKSYHISKAVLEIPVDGKVPAKRVQLMLEQNKTHYLLCNLDSEKIVQVDCDYIFTEGEEVTFYLNGDGVVHLSGYVLDFDEGDEFDDEGLSDEESEDEPVLNANSKRMLSAAADSTNAKKAKADPKVKAVNGTAEEDEEDDEEDDDFLGKLDEEFESEEDEEDDEELDDEDDDDEEEEETIKPAPKPVQAAKQINGQAGKPLQQKGTPGKGPQNQQQKNAGKPNQTPNKGQQQQQQQKNAGKPNQTPNKGGQQQQNNQNKFGQNNKGPSPQQKPFNQNKQQFNKGSFTPDQKQKGVKKLPGGLQIEDVHTGSGPEARTGKFAHVRYIGRLFKNNKEFDRSVKPFSFKLGAGQVIKGWDLGVEGMKVGGKRKIVVPPNMGYGSKSMGPIPANSTLNFEIELLSVS